MMDDEQEIGSYVLSYNFISHISELNKCYVFIFFLVWEKCELFPCKFKIEFSNVFYFLSWNCKGLFTTHKISQFNIRKYFRVWGIYGWMFDKFYTK